MTTSENAFETKRKIYQPKNRDPLPRIGTIKISKANPAVLCPGNSHLMSTRTSRTQITTPQFFTHEEMTSYPGLSRKESSPQRTLASQSSPCSQSCSSAPSSASSSPPTNTQHQVLKQNFNPQVSASQHQTTKAGPP